MRLRRGTLVSGLVMAISAVVFAAAAFACTNLATIDTPTLAAPSGSNVTFTGTSFAGKGAGPVVLHWNGATGPELARATPDGAGNVSASFSVPKADPGYYVLVATQTNDKGKPVYGTPARSSFQVVGPDGKAPASPAVAPQPPINSAPSGSNGVLVLTFALGAAGLALFGAGFTSMVRSRRRSQPATSPARHD